MRERANEKWANGRTGERANGRTGERANGRTGERANGRTGERANGRTGERTGFTTLSLTPKLKGTSKIRKSVSERTFPSLPKNFIMVEIARNRCKTRLYCNYTKNFSMVTTQ